MDIELKIIHWKNTPPDELFDSVQDDFTNRLCELNLAELEELKAHFINKEWFSYLRSIQNEIDNYEK